MTGVEETEEEDRVVCFQRSSPLYTGMRMGAKDSSKWRNYSRTLLLEVAEVITAFAAVLRPHPLMCGRGADSDSCREMSRDLLLSLTLIFFST